MAGRMPTQNDEDLRRARMAADVIPLDLIRAIAREPVLPSDPAARQAQTDRIRTLVAYQPLHVRRIARAVLRARWDRSRPTS